MNRPQSKYVVGDGPDKELIEDLLAAADNADLNPKSLQQRLYQAADRLHELQSRPQQAARGVTDDEIAAIAYRVGYGITYDDAEGNCTEEPHLWDEDGEDNFDTVAKFARKLLERSAAPLLAPSPDAQRVPSFEELWAVKEKEGYRYGRDALEQVRFGYDIAVAALGEKK